MKNQRVVLITLGVIGVFVIAFIFFYPKQTSWYVSFGENKNPYDVDFFYELIEESNPDIDIDRILDYYDQSLKSINDSTLNLVKLDYTIEFDSTDIHHLLGFVEKGNKAFFISKNPPEILMANLHFGVDSIQRMNRILNTTNNYNSYEYEIYDSIREVKDSLLDVLNSNFGTWGIERNQPVQVRIEDAENSLFVRDKEGDTIYYEHRYYDFEDIGFKHDVLGTLIDSDTNNIILNKDKSKVLIDSSGVSKSNYIKVNYGKGSIYFHCSPLAFTNINLYRKPTLNYAKEFVKEFNNGDVYIDKFYHRFRTSYQPRGRNSRLSESPLAFILSISTLKWAWYTILLGAFIFIVFRSKRQQRIIPVIAPLKNNSLEFSKTVGRLFYKEKNNKRIAQELCLYFFNHLRKRYHINTKTFDNSAKERFLKLFPQEKRRVNIIAHLSVKSFKKDTHISPEELKDLYESTRYFIIKS